MPVEVTEKWLGDIGGWAALKSARQLVQTDMVEEATRTGDVFTGMVKIGRRPMKSSLTAINAKDALCRCPCEDATRRGLVCAHSLAVALSVIEKGRGETGARGFSPQQSHAVQPKQIVVDEKLPAVRGVFQITLDLLRIIAQPQRAHTVLVKLLPGEEAADPRIVRWLMRNQLPCSTQALSLGGDDLGGLLGELESYSHTYSHSGKGVAIGGNALIISTYKQLALISELNNAQTVHFQFVSNDSSILRLGRDQWLVSGSQQITRLNLFGSAEVAILLTELCQDRSAERPVNWLVRHREEMEVVFSLETRGDLARLKIEPANPIIEVCLDGSLRQVEVTLNAVVDASVRHPVSSMRTSDIEKMYPVQSKEDNIIYYVRNMRRESAVLQHFLGMGFTPTPDQKMRLTGEDKVLKFFGSELPRLRRLFQVITTERWDTVTQGIQRVQPRIKVQEPTRNEQREPGADWLSLEVAYTTDSGFKVGRNEVLRLLRGGKSSMRGQDGRIFVLDETACEEFEETLEDANSRFESGQVFRVAADAGELWTSFAERPAALTPESTRLLPDSELHVMIGKMASILRPYQLEGVRWLERVHRLQRGALLADEMGLGKTLQSLSLLQALTTKGRAGTERPQSAPALVVCPTSLVHNWAAEAARFTPDLRCTVLHGDDRRSQLACLDEPGIVITSYGLIARDLELYRARIFQTLIMDEASHIRNPDTAAAKALRQIRAQSRFALTGTPVENSVQDLWSIFQVLIPGHLGARDEFRDRYQKPIANTSESADRAKAVQRLRRRVSPYILRRTKAEVAKDLPEKIEKIVWCELTPLQTEYYQRILEEGREEIRQAKRSSGQGGARATMFTVLLRLRQVCNDLRLIGVSQDANGSDEEEPPHSGKWTAMTDFLQELRDNGGKALIFSQFVSMLKLLKPLVEATGLGLSYLDGQSTDRAAQVQAFQTDESRRVFLISLKAGGYGLTLTAADQVVLYDPWWNPAVEAQAIDRAHRIGQTQPVTAHRFATRGTVEEKMLQLQARKREAAEMTIEDNPVVLTGLTEDDLEAMLA